jgi:truncated hemoglobin YjbI
MAPEHSGSREEPDLTTMSLDELRERDELMRQLLDTTRRLRALHDPVSSSPSLPPARRQIMKPPPHETLYRTTDYAAYRGFISRIESTAEACGLDDAEVVAYAIMGLVYTEKDLWQIHIQDTPAKETWKEMTEFLLLRMGDPANRTRNAWRALLRMRHRDDEEDYQWLQRFEEKTREIGEEFQDSGKFAKHLFLLGLDKPMRDRLDELAELPDDLLEIAYIATRIRPSLSHEADLASHHDSEEETNGSSLEESMDFGSEASDL